MRRVRPVMAISAVNLRRLFADKVGLFFTFVLPILIIVLLGAAFSGEDLLVGVVDDDGSELSAQLADALDEEENLSLRRFGSVDELEKAVRRSGAEGGVVIPAGYADALAAGGTATVQYVAEVGSGDAAAFQSRVGAVVAEQAALAQAARLAVAEGGVASFADALALAEATAGEVAVGGLDVSTAGGGARSLTPGQYATIGELVLFVFLIGLAGSGDLVLTRTLGVSRRMLATPLTTRGIVLGEGGGRFGVAGVQSVFIVAFTALLFGIAWGNPFAVTALLVAFALVATGASLLMGSIARNSEQAGSLGPLLGIPLGMLGGCMWPLEIVPEGLRAVGHLTPHAWAVDGLVATMGEGAGLADVTTELAVLLGFAAVLLPLASWRLHRAITG